MSAESWKLTGFGRKESIKAALLAHEEAVDFDPEIAIMGFEITQDRPDEWRLDAYLPRRPTPSDLDAIGALFQGDTPEFSCAPLPDEDWLLVSQRGIDPIRAGRFYIHTPDHAPDRAPDSGAVNLCIPASQAFGTGQHETTAGCLAMLDAMKHSGVVARNLADIGTGTGLLAFAAMHLWPNAFASASDIDPVCAGVIAENAALNAVKLGGGRGELALSIAAGMDDDLLQSRAPFDLLVANILAAPLIALAEDFAGALVPGANLLLAGLLESQEAALRRAYRRAGFRLARRMVDGDWSILWLRKRRFC